MNRKILLIGGGGHCKSVLDSLISLNAFSEIGIVDKTDNIGKFVMGTPVVGCDDDLLSLFNRGYSYAFVTVGSIGYPHLRIKLSNIIQDLGFIVPSIIDMSANVSDYANVEQGVYIGKQCIVNAGSTIQYGAIVNSGSIVEHDCNVGKFAHIAPGAVLGGEVIIGCEAHIGLNSSVKQQVIIGRSSIIGMGSVVLKNISDSTLAYGNPCQEVKRL
jgi:sugar O-acyltransferase (sialic acid O-acetyltransferase NeuD family)